MYAHSNKAFAPRPRDAITRVFTQKYSYWLTNRGAVIFFFFVLIFLNIYGASIFAAAVQKQKSRCKEKYCDTIVARFAYSARRVPHSLEHGFPYLVYRV